MNQIAKLSWVVLVLGGTWLGLTHSACADEPPAQVREFLAQHCLECHDSNTKKAGLDLSAKQIDWRDSVHFTRWLKVHERLELGEMPPKNKAKPDAKSQAATLAWLKQSLVQAETARAGAEDRTVVRRLTRAEYENTIRSLFSLPGINLKEGLPPDGSAHGFDKHHEALDISHVSLASYLETADKVLDAAIAVRPDAPPVLKQRVSLAESYIVRVVLTQSDAVLLKNGQPDPKLPIAGEHRHIGLGEHERMGLLDPTSSVGIFRHEDDAFDPGFRAFATVYGGRYHFRISLWSFGWDKGKVVPARGTEAVRLSVVQLQNRGLGGGHPSFTLAYFDAPPDKPKVHEFEHWLNPHETIGYNVSSLVPRRVGEQKGRAQAYVGPGVANDWLEVEGPVFEAWPPPGHRLLFGELPIVEYKPKDHVGLRLPTRKVIRQEMIGAKNHPAPFTGIWSVQSKNPLVDADRLLADFLPKAFRRPVSEQTRKQYVSLVEKKLAAGDCFELAMRWAYRAALCSPDFLYHLEPAKQLDDFALSARLSYFLWNSPPDAQLTELAQAGKLHEPKILRAQTERLLNDPKSQRFVTDFLGQWLKLREIGTTDPDRKLYPEFSPYLQDAMVAETHAYFRALLEKNLDAKHLVRSDFAMLNEVLAKHYGLTGVVGSQIRSVKLPADCPRGGLLTQASLLKVTANGTTTSPVPRGAFVMDRLLGKPPEPPPPNVPAVEPDVRGTTTIREMLDKHRNNASCAGCHAKIDPPGFALESFDVIGGYRTRYRSIGEGDKPERGLLDPFVPLSFKLGPKVDSSGVMPDGRKFNDIREFQALLADQPEVLLRNLTKQWAVYSTGRACTFRDRDALNEVVAATQKQGGGLRTLLHEFVQSRLFQTR